MTEGTGDVKINLLNPQNVLLNSSGKSHGMADFPNMYIFDP